MYFQIDNWSAWDEKCSTRAQWDAWGQGLEDTTEAIDLDISMIPAMHRRRMSRFSKMMVSTASQCMEGIDELPLCVFATRHGELTRTLKILHDIVSCNDVSPTDFSMSVHNTSLGLYSIFNDNKLPSTLVVAGQDTFGAAMLEANIYLDRFRGRRVLLVYTDESVPPPVKSQDDLPDESISIALLLSASVPGKGISLDFSPNLEEAGDGICLARSFLHFYLSGVRSLSHRTTRSCWKWSQP